MASLPGLRRTGPRVVALTRPPDGALMLLRPTWHIYNGYMTDTPIPPTETGPVDPEEQIFWQEVQERLVEKTKQMIDAVEVCLKQDLWEPALILILSHIDALAWLSRPADRDDVTRPDFVAWIDKYLLPDSNLECTAEELYGARCGLLHSHTGESRLHRQHKIRKIFWSRAQGDNVYTLIQIRMNEKLLPVGVGIDHLFWALRRALEQFGGALDEDRELGRLVGERILNSYFLRARRAG
jgi:hypothetical protein